MCGEIQACAGFFENDQVKSNAMVVVAMAD